LNGPALSVKAAEPKQFERIRALLDDARLPTRDLAPSSVDGFLVATDAQEVIGAVALERYGNVGLLRSLVVTPRRKGEGLGKAMVHALEQRARAEGIESLVLLTETAKDFFAALGYRVGQRAAASVAVQASSEFAYVCPASAVYMEKPL
jgi:amino-acid N-acetyltransferase